MSLYGVMIWLNMDMEERSIHELDIVYIFLEMKQTFYGLS